ncbi:ABC transporter substrate-binding protein [Streptomyces hayashii]|uniref:ABC transporter substrate-binding protein n=1 Tax=Streptomyces hayashii TaxID=2839966 RepID=UPI00403CA4EB
MLPRRRQSIVLAVGAATAGMLAAACSPGGSQAGGGKNPDTLTIAMAADPTSVEPCDSQAANGIGTLRGNVTESLTDVDPRTGKVQALLARSWRQDNPTTWTFKLRSGVKFQDGTPFDAAAAVFNIKRTMQPRLGCLNLSNIPEPFTARAVDDTTLQVVTKAPDPILPLRIAWIDMVSTRSPMASKTSQPVGTGPYSFVRYTPGASLEFKKFDGYWGSKPQARAVKYVFRSEASVRAATAKTGEADIAVPIAPQDATSGDRTRTFTESRVFMLRLDTDQAPLDDVDVRRAIGYAVDKKKIVGSLMNRIGKPTDQMVTTTVNGHITGYKGPAYDPDKAKALIKKARDAGVDTGKQIELIARNTLFPGSGDVMEAIVQNLEDAGLNVKAVEIDDNAYKERLRVTSDSGQPPAILAVTHDNALGDAAFSFPKYMSSSGPVSTIDDPRMDSLLQRASVASGQERASLYQQAARRAYEDEAAIVPIAEQFGLLLLNRGVEYQPNGLTGIELPAAQVKLSR